MDVQQQVNSALFSSLLITGISIAASVMFTIVIIVFVMRYVRTMSGADLRGSGIAAQATVVKMWDTGTTINENPVAGMVLEVQQPGQLPYQVETKSMIPRLAVGRVQPGATVAVKIDPANQQRVVLDLFAS